MPATTLTDANRARLRGVSTATLSTVLLGRGLRNAFVQGVRAFGVLAPRMVGEAYTLRYIPAREDLDQLGAFDDAHHPQRRAVEEIPPGHVLVIDSRRDPRAASMGGILITRVMKRGAAGVVTDGSLRDTPDLAQLPFPTYAAQAAAPLNLSFHHAADLNVPIGCGGVAVYPGDITVGDNEGVVVIPAHLANEVAEQAAETTAFEDWVEQQVHAGRSIFGLYPPDQATCAEYEAWRSGHPA